MIEVMEKVLKKLKIAAIEGGGAGASVGTNCSNTYRILSANAGRAA